MATSGALVRALEYNTVQSTISNILGVGSGQSGYGQAVTTSQVSANVTTITAAQWANLKAEMLTIAAHAGLSAAPQVTAVPNITAGSVISATDTTAFETAATYLNANKYALALFSDENFSPSINQSRGTSWGAPAQPTIRHSFTVDFASANNARYFFNSGSSIRFTSAQSGGTTLQNLDWRNLLSAMGTVVFNYNSTSASSGTGSAIGFYQLTNVSTHIFTKTGSGIYSGNDYTIFARCDVANNTNGGARFIYIDIYWNDDHANAFADSVTGTITSDVTLRRASAVGGVTVTAPTAVNTTLLTA